MLSKHLSFSSRNRREDEVHHVVDCHNAQNLVLRVDHRNRKEIVFGDYVRHPLGIEKKPFQLISRKAPVKELMGALAPSLQDLLKSGMFY